MKFLRRIRLIAVFIFGVVPLQSSCTTDQTVRTTHVIVQGSPPVIEVQSDVQIRAQRTQQISANSQENRRQLGTVAADSTVTTVEPSRTRCYADGERHPQQVADLSAGRGHACVALVDGTVRCWGFNYDGQLGDGTRSNHNAPIVVEGLADIVQVRVGWDFSCALSRAGSVWCWGENDYAQVGTGANHPDRPTLVRGIDHATQLAVGHTHACALGADHRVRCWGHNQFGELGDGTLTQRVHPVTPRAAQTVSQLAAGSGATCGLHADRSIWCAGWLTRSQTPTRVEGLRAPVADIALGDNFACATTVEGTAWCWGEGFAGQLGNENVTEVHVPRAIRGLTELAQVSLGPHGGCAVKTTGELWCWGRVGAENPQANGTQLGRAPYGVASLSGVAQVSVGENFVCARMTAGGVCCFGDNLYGQLGDNSTHPAQAERPSPVRW